MSQGRDPAIKLFGRNIPLTDFRTPTVSEQDSDLEPQASSNPLAMVIPKYPFKPYSFLCNCYVSINGNFDGLALAWIAFYICRERHYLTFCLFGMEVCLIYM